MDFKRLCKTLISFEASPGDLRVIDVLIVDSVMGTSKNKRFLVLLRT